MKQTAMTPEERKKASSKRARQVRRMTSGPGMLLECFTSTNDQERTIVAFREASCDVEEFIEMYIASGVLYEPLEKLIKEVILDNSPKVNTRRRLRTALRSGQALGGTFTEKFDQQHAEALERQNAKDHRGINSEFQRATLLASEHIRNAKLRTLFHL